MGSSSALMQCRDRSPEVESKQETRSALTFISGFLRYDKVGRSYESFEHRLRCQTSACPLSARPIASFQTQVEIRHCPFRPCCSHWVQTFVGNRVGQQPVGPWQAFQATMWSMPRATTLLRLRIGQPFLSPSSHHVRPTRHWQVVSTPGRRVLPGPRPHVANVLALRKRLLPGPRPHVANVLALRKRLLPGPRPHVANVLALRKRLLPGRLSVRNVFHNPQAPPRSDVLLHAWLPGRADYLRAPLALQIFRRD